MQKPSDYFQKEIEALRLRRNSFERQYTFFAYKEGQSYQFDTHLEAQKISRNIEKVQDPENKKLEEALSQELSYWNQKAYDAWYIYTREYFYQLSDKLFEYFFSKARERSDGLSNLFEELEGLVDIYDDAIAIYKEETK